MNIRVTDSSTKSGLTARIGAQQSRLSVLEERLTSGKRINRPSDDPNGAEVVINLKTSQTEIEQFKRNAVTSNQKLTASDEALNSYENILDRLKTLTSNGLSDTATQPARNALASEVEALGARILNIANLKQGDDFVFGGTRQNAPPFDPATRMPAAAPNGAAYVQIEPGTSAIAVGVTAETVFSDANSTIFNDLTAAVSALRGTGDGAADRAALESTMSRLSVYADLSGVARTRVGVSMNTAETAIDRLGADSFSLEERISTIESADFAETAISFAETQRALEATLQVAAKGRRTLLDFLG